MYTVLSHGNRKALAMCDGEVATAKLCSGGIRVRFTLPSTTGSFEVYVTVGIEVASVTANVHRLSDLRVREHGIACFSKHTYILFESPAVIVGQRWFGVSRLTQE